MRTPRPKDKREYGAGGLPDDNLAKRTGLAQARLVFEAALASVEDMGIPRFAWAAVVVLSLALLGEGIAFSGQLSILAPVPDWSKLEPYQKTITRDEFTRLINQIYSPSGDFWKFAVIDDRKLVLYSDIAHTERLWQLNFAASTQACLSRPYLYKTAAVSKDPTRPLQGIRIALDPGHIGGDWAKLEERYFKLGHDPSVEEATLNMITCKILAQLLEADGAEIVWAKHGYQPTTPLRPASLHREAIAALALSPDSGKRKRDEAAIEGMINRQAALLFYRTAEIRARGDLVNSLHPDLTICVHYNADDWNDPNNPTLVDKSRLVIFLNGSYERSELVNDDMKYDLLRKLLDRTADQEERGCALVGQEMLDTLKYPPESFTAYFAHHVSDVPSVFTRNLMASRLYHGPVIYCEGPYMNARDAYYRIVAGDYLGLKTIQGEAVPSIYRQYATSVEQGVLKYFEVK